MTGRLLVSALPLDPSQASDGPAWLLPQFLGRPLDDPVPVTGPPPKDSHALTAMLVVGGIIVVIAVVMCVYFVCALSPEPPAGRRRECCATRYLRAGKAFFKGGAAYKSVGGGAQLVVMGEEDSWRNDTHKRGFKGTTTSSSKFGLIEEGEEESRSRSSESMDDIDF